MKVVEFAGWQCAEILSGSVRAFVTLEVGPRVIYLGESENLFYVKPETRGQKGGDDYRGYGGHRLWSAPENKEFTLIPENDPVEVLRSSDTSIAVAAPRDRFGRKRSFELLALGEGAFEIRHEIDALPADQAIWALSVMAAGGECWFPGPPFISHAEKVLPAGPIALWNYTNLGDPRWSFSPEGIRLRQTSEGGPQKVGAWVDSGWAAYVRDGWQFLKTFSSEPGRYPDYGVNFEVFTRTDMLEVETLAPFGQRSWIESWQVSQPAEVSWRALAESAEELRRR